MADKHPFLSDEWIAAVKALREEYRGKTQAPGHTVRMNQIITDVPFGGGVIQSHLDTTDGHFEMELGHLEAPDVTLTLDYATARAVFVEGDHEAAMQAFMGGKIKVQGDMAKLLALLQDPVDPLGLEVSERMKAITE